MTKIIEIHPEESDQCVEGPQNDVMFRMFKELEMFSLKKEDSGTRIPSSNVRRAGIEEGLDKFPMVPRR